MSNLDQSEPCVAKMKLPIAQQARNFFTLYLLSNYDFSRSPSTEMVAALVKAKWQWCNSNKLYTLKAGNMKFCTKIQTIL